MNERVRQRQAVCEPESAKTRSLESRGPRQLAPAALPASGDESSELGESIGASMFGTRPYSQNTRGMTATLFASWHSRLVLVLSGTM